MHGFSDDPYNQEDAKRDDNLRRSEPLATRRRSLRSCSGVETHLGHKIPPLLFIDLHNRFLDILLAQTLLLVVVLALFGPGPRSAMS